MIGTAATVASVIPVLIGMGRGIGGGWRGRLWLWLTFLAVENVLLRVLSWQGVPTGWVTWACYLPAVWLGVTALFAFPTMRPFRGWMVPLGSLFTVVWGVAPFLGDRQLGYSVFVAPFHAVLLAALGVWLFFRATGPERVLARAPQATAAAVGLTYLPFLLVWPVSVYLAQTSPDLVLPLWEARAGLLIVASALFAVALW